MERGYKRMQSSIHVGISMDIHSRGLGTMVDLMLIIPPVLGLFLLYIEPAED